MGKKKIIEIMDLRYSYPDGTGALDGISLDIYEAESVGIIGPNGAGKSTLLLHLNGILRGSGEVKISGLQVRQENLACIRSKVGLVFQDPDHQLFMPTVFADVSFGPMHMGLTETEVKRRVGEALTEVQMQDAAGKSSHHLSLGEKRRISLATVLSMRPQVLVLDEPSSNLDPRSRRHLIDMLKGLSLTKVISGHDLEMILEVCERAVVLYKGRMVAEGPTRDILADASLMGLYDLEVPPSLRIEAEDRQPVV